MDERLNAIIAALRANELPVGWKWVMGDSIGAEKPDFDDSAWPAALRPIQGRRWEEVWFRAVLPFSPLLVGDVTAMVVPGGWLTVYVDGCAIAEGYGLEVPVPAPNGRPIPIAVRSANGELANGHGVMRFRSDRLREIKTLRRSLDFVLQWRKARPDLADRIDPVLARYAEAVDPAIYEGAPSVFLEDVRAATEILRELDPLAKEYTVHIVPHSHVDLTWGWDFAETKRLGRAMFDSALRVMEEDPDYTFVQDMPPMYVHLEGSATEKAVARRIAEGRWEIPGATFSEPESFMPGGESWVRHLLYSKRYFKERFGADISVHWAPDNFSGHASTLPQIWKLCGIKAFAFGNWYRADHRGHFLWEGLDGSRIFSHYFTGHYDSAQIIEQDKVIKHVCDHMASTSIPKCMLLDGDDLTPAWPESPAGIEKLRALAAFPKVLFSTPHRFFADIDPEKMDLRVVSGELVSARTNDCGSYSTFVEVKRRNRRGEWALRTTEALAALAMRDGGLYPSKHVARAWRLILFNQMHDIMPGTAIIEAYENEVFKRYDEVDSICTIGTNAVANVLAANVDTRGEGIPIVLFNTLGWDRTDAAEVALTETQDYRNEFEAVDAAGRAVPVQVLESTVGSFQTLTKNYRLLVQPATVPAMGHATVWLRAVREQTPAPSMIGPDGLTLDNSAVRVKINSRTGWITSFFDKRLGREILAPGREGCALEAYTDKGNPWHLVQEGLPWNLNTTVRAEVVEDGAIRAAIRVTTTWHDTTLVQTFRIYRNSARLEVHSEIDFHEDHKVVKMVFPAALSPEATWTCEVPWGAVERPIPDNDRASQTWVDLTGGTDGAKWGVAILNNGRYGHSRREDGALTMTLVRAVFPHMALCQSDAGRHEFTYAILPHAGDWRESDVVREAHALNAPICANRDIPHEGKRPASASRICVGQPNIVLAALKKAEDADDEWVLHLYEATGRATEATVTFDAPLAFARDTNLMEWNDGAALAFDGTTVRRSFRPWEIAGIRVKLA